MFSPSYPWWERHFVCSRGTRAHGISTAVVLHQSHRCEENAPLFERSAKTKRESVRRVSLPPRVPIMKVVARHEGDSKIDVQYYWTWWRCRWPTQWACPRALLEVAALGEKA